MVNAATIMTTTTTRASRKISKRQSVRQWAVAPFRSCVTPCLLPAGPPTCVSAAYFLACLRSVTARPNASTCVPLVRTAVKKLEKRGVFYIGTVLYTGEKKAF